MCEREKEREDASVLILFHSIPFCHMQGENEHDDEGLEKAADAR